LIVATNPAHNDVDLVFPNSDKVIKAIGCEFQFPQDIFGQYPYLWPILVLMVREMYLPSVLNWSLLVQIVKTIMVILSHISRFKTFLIKTEAVISGAL
jgi:hypothetical protein